MTSTLLRREILRLARVTGSGVCIRTQQLSAFYGIRETQVRKTLAELAEQKLISLAGWDGCQLRAFNSWPSASEFVNSTFDGGRVLVGVPSPTPQTDQL